MKNPQTLMVQGTTSDAGKSILVTAIGRILARKGINVAPFKSQNMALNSAVAIEGGEIGRAQAVQAQACYLQPSVLMNPVLLKPHSDIGAEVIVLGKVRGTMNADAYHHKKPSLLGEVLEAYRQLQAKHPVIVVEGAGSPAEINLRDRDIANMGFAEAVDCPVIIVADIDRGGVFAHLVGTYDLLSDTEKARIKGFVINRFRGDINLLMPGVQWLEARLSVPVLGVIPYIENLAIEAEDAINVHQQSKSEDALKVVAIAYPRSSIHTDVDALRLHPDISLEWLRDSHAFTGADVIILPGSTQVGADLQWLRAQGWDTIIYRHLRYGGKVLGICGGFQMLGEQVHDPYGLESAVGSSTGLNLLAMETTFEKEKITRNVQGHILPQQGTVKGYEIHSGRSTGKALERAVFSLYDENFPDAPYLDGALSEDEQILGTYLHGVFDTPDAVAYFLRWAGRRQGQAKDHSALQEQEIERLADAVEAAIPFERWQALLQL